MFSRHSKLLDTSKLSFSLDDMRRKSIVKKINRERVNSFTEPLSQKEDYIIVPDDILINLSEKKCEEYDIYNNDLYRKNIKLFQDVKEKLSGSVLELKNEPLAPAGPTNLERLILLKQRTLPINCLDQTAAVLYLLSHGYTLVYDIFAPVTNPTNKKLVSFEPYQAIAFANELSHIRGENWRDISRKFNTYKITEANNTIPSAPPIKQELDTVGCKNILQSGWESSTGICHNTTTKDSLAHTSLRNKECNDNLSLGNTLESSIMYNKYIPPPLIKPASHF